MKYRITKTAKFIIPQMSDDLIGRDIPSGEINRYFTDYQLDNLINAEVVLEIPDQEDYFREFRNSEDSYMILQLRHEDETAYERFESYGNLEKMGKQPNPNHYEAVYVGGFSANLFRQENASMVLENLYEAFNLDDLIPDDFYGHRLSVSDIVALKLRTEAGGPYTVTYHYVDSIGFRELKDFVKVTE